MAIRLLCTEIHRATQHNLWPTSPTQLPKIENQYQNEGNQRLYFFYQIIIIEQTY